jgi:small subunit ribosomal protein S4
VSASDEITIREKSKKQVRIQGALALAEQYGFVDWVEVDTKAMKGSLKRVPDRADLSAEINEQLVVELYSK